MANTIKLKRSATPGKVPTTSDLALGELGMNTTDGALYMKRNTGVDEVLCIFLASQDYGSISSAAGTIFDYGAL